MYFAEPVALKIVRVRARWSVVTLPGGALNQTDSAPARTSSTWKEVVLNPLTQFQDIHNRL